MLRTINESIATRRGMVATLVGAAVLGLTPCAEAFAPNMPNTGQNREMCRYSLELQASVEARRDYLVRLEQAVGAAYGGNSVQEMYGNVQPASLQEDEEVDGNGRRSVASLFRKFGNRQSAAPGLDPFSADCVSCHDGVAASAIGVDLRDRPYGRKPQVVSFQSDHPVGMTYSSYASSRKGYKQIGAGTRMVFVNGKVGCLTCHDPLSKERGRLVMSDYRSALCLTCHDK